MSLSRKHSIKNCLGIYDRSKQEMSPLGDLTDPMKSGSSGSRTKTFDRASISTGSPFGVPVPWHSTYDVSRGLSLALRYAWRMTRAWASTSGAEIPAVLPLLRLDISSSHRAQLHGQHLVSSLRAYVRANRRSPDHRSDRVIVL